MQYFKRVLAPFNQTVFYTTEVIMSKQSRRRARRHKTKPAKKTYHNPAANAAIAREGETAANRLRIVIPAHIDPASVSHWDQDRLEAAFGVPA